MTTSPSRPSRRLHHAISPPRCPELMAATWAAAAGAFVPSGRSRTLRRRVRPPRPLQSEPDADLRIGLPGRHRTLLVSFRRRSSRLRGQEFLMRLARSPACSINARPSSTADSTTATPTAEDPGVWDQTHAIVVARIAERLPHLGRRCPAGYGPLPRGRRRSPRKRTDRAYRNSTSSHGRRFGGVVGCSTDRRRPDRIAAPRR